MANSQMNTLLTNLVTIFEAAITAGTITASKVFLGLQDAPAQAADTEYPYIMLDDGGERTDPTNPNSSTQNRIFKVVIELGTYSLESISAAMVDILNLTQQVKDVLELEANRQLDDFIWGIDITPFGWSSEDTFFRGRQIIMEWTLEEDTYEDRY